MYKRQVEGYSNGVSATNGKVDASNMNTVLASGKTVDVTKVTVRVAFHDEIGRASCRERVSSPV